MKPPSFKGRQRIHSKSPQLKFPLFNIRVERWPPVVRTLINWTITFGSVLLCLLMLPTRFVGMELLGIGPNWLLIWVVAWSVKRSVWEGILAGVVLGLLQDAMTSPDPTHVISLGCVGGLTALLQKQRFIQEDFISIALIVFVMTLVADSILGLQLTLIADSNLESIWAYYQRGALASAILSSLWAPCVYYPLNVWWQKCNLVKN
jgi:rod shape-determining protein MreD